MMSTTEIDCAACGNSVAPQTLSGGHCPECRRLVPIPLVFAYVAEDPATAGALAAGEAAQWLLNHRVTREQLISTDVSTSVGGLVDFPFGYTLTLLVEVPKFLIEDHTADDLSDIPVYELVESASA